MSTFSSVEHLLGENKRERERLSRIPNVNIESPEPNLYTQIAFIEDNSDESTDAEIADSLPPENDVPDTIKETFLQMWSNNWREFIPILPGLVVVFASSYHLTWTVNEYLTKASLSPWHVAWMKEFDFQSTPFDFYIPQMVNWFAGAILGSIIGAVLISILEKRYIYVSIEAECGCRKISFSKNFSLQTIGCIFLAVAGYWQIAYSSATHLTTEQDRLLSGVSFGISNLTVIIHASDITSKQMRQFALTCVALAMGLSLIMFQIPKPKISLYNQENKILHGYILALIAAVATILTVLTNESIPHLIAHGKSERALELLTNYNAETTPSTKTRNLFEQLKSAVEADQSKSRNIFSADNLRPLLVFCAARLLHLFSSSIPILKLSITCLHYIIKKVPVLSVCSETVFYSAFFCARLIHGWIGLCLSGFTDRYRVYHGLAAFSGILIFSVLLLISLFHDNIPLVVELVSLYLFLNHLTAFGLDTIQILYVAELFPMKKRAWSIVVGDILEHTTHGILLVLYNFGYVNFVILLTGLGLVGNTLLMHRFQNEKIRKAIADLKPF